MYGTDKAGGYTMRRLFIVTVMFFFSVVLHAQNDVTRFLGIPVDGSKQEMIQKLKEKGFTEYGNDFLRGEFNGAEVLLNVVTNNRKVYRIMVSDLSEVSETDIKIRFNNLCLQFLNNSKYAPSSLDQTIPDDENIHYEINKKRYEATFYQISPNDTTVEQRFNRLVWFMISEGVKYDTYRICMFYDNVKNQANGEDL